MNETNETNLSSNDSMYCDYEQKWINDVPVQLAFSLLYLIIFCLGFFGNILVIVAVLHLRWSPFVKIWFCCLLNLRPWSGNFSYAAQPQDMRHPKKIEIHLFPALRAFWFLEKSALSKIRISGTVLMFQLTQNSPTNAYIR